MDNKKQDMPPFGTHTCDDIQKSAHSQKIPQDVMQRSQKMIKLLNGAKGVELKKLPVPPFTKWLNGKILGVKRGEVIVEFEIRSEMANPTKLLHGGIHSAMMDDTIGIACSTLGYEGFLITIDFHVDFLGKAKVGDTVQVRAKIVREGRTIVHAQSMIYNIQEDTISSAQANLLITKHTPDYNKMIDSKDS